MQIVGEAGLRVTALTRELGRSLRKSVGDALKSIKAPKQNALTELQRELRRGELDLAKAHEAVSKARRDAKASEEALNALRKDSRATTEQIVEAERKHSRSLLEVQVAVDKVNAATERQHKLRERVRKGTIDLGRDNDRLSKSFLGVAKAVGGLIGGLGKAATTGLKIALVSTVAAGAVAGVASLTTSVFALVAALGQASGAALVLPAAFVGIKAVTATVRLGMVGMGDAMKAVAEGDAAKLQEAMRDMAPSARQFVTEVNKAKPAFDRLRLDVQQRMFKGLSGSVGELAERYLPVAHRLFGGMAETLNGMARDVINFAMSSRALDDTNTTVTNLRTSFASLRPALAPAVEALLNVIQVGSSFLPRMTASLSGGIQAFSARINEMAANGELEAFIQQAMATMRQLGRIAGNVGSTISGIFRAAQSAGGGFLANLELITQAMSRWVNSLQGQTALTSFFASMRAILQALAPVVSTLASIIGTTLAPIIANIATTILPVINPLLQAFGQLLAAAAPLIDVLAETLAVLLAALQPVVEVFAATLQDVMPQLLPAIMAIGEAFAQLITAAAPLAPLFLQVVTALLPIIPPILQLVSALLPPLISLLQAVMPVITAFAAGFAATLPVLGQVAAFILNILIPPIRLIAAVVAGAINLSVAIFSGFVAFVRGAVQRVISFIGFLGSIPGRVSGFFQRMRDGAVQRAISLVNWVKALPGRIIGAIGDLGAKLWNAGVEAIQGLLNGLKSAAGAVIDWIKGLAGDLVDSVLGTLGIASPSKVFARIGRDVGRGLIVGLREITPAVSDAAGKMITVATDAAHPQPLIDLARTGAIDRALTPRLPAGVTPAGGDGASAPTDAAAIAEGVARGMEGMRVVVSSTEVTSRVNARNRSDGRR